MRERHFVIDVSAFPHMHIGIRWELVRTSQQMNTSRSKRVSFARFCKSEDTHHPVKEIDAMSTTETRFVCSNSSMMCVSLQDRDLFTRDA